METVTITLNGVEVSGYSGMTVLDLARESGIDIPTLCHDPHLTPLGACRICLVEEERTGALLASCVTLIAPGMVVNTQSPRVLERRRAIIRLMLASHPDSCFVCDKGNRCQLRHIAAEMGIGLVEFQRIPQFAAIEEVNPFIERDLSKCILCAKCIRADQELVVEGAIDYMNRGFASKPATLNDQPLEKSECTFCGTCVSLCPTGALMEKVKTYRGTVTTVVPTVCPFCGCGCGIHLEVRDNKIVRVRPNDRGSSNGPTLCVRGCYGYDFVHSPERLTTPLVRVNGRLEAASWEQALGLVAQELERIKAAHGPDSLAVLGSSKCTNEENYLLQKLARAVLGTNNIDNGSRLYSSASRVGLAKSLGLPGTTNPLSDIEQSQVILVIGANPTASAPVVGYAIKRAVKQKDARLLLVDPQPTKLSAFADIWLRPKLGTDVALINGLIKVIIDEGLWDRGFVAARTQDFETWAGSLHKYSPEYVEEATGVSAEEIRRAARLFAGASRGSIVYGNGIAQQVGGTGAVQALANLALVTGNIGRRGTGLYALLRENNAQGASDMGALPDYLPGYQGVGDMAARRRFEEGWGVRLPDRAGLTALEMIRGAKEGSIRAMYIVGENPVSTFPSPSSVREALASLEFLVVQDLFLTETAELAMVVLPAASFAEKDGTFTNLERRVHRVRKAIEPPGQSWPDWHIIVQLAQRMGCPMPYSSPRQVMDEIGELVPLYRGIDYADLEMGGVHWPPPDGDPSGTRRLYETGFPHGLARFAPVDYMAGELSQDGYPLKLVAGSVLFHFGGGTRSSKSLRLRKMSPQGFVEISVGDAQALGIAHGEMVRVVSPQGEVIARASLTDRLPAGMLFMPISFPESPVGELFGLPPDSQTPALKTCAVRLERNGPHG
ncbi:MAG TPA: formate dehydrogenase subunit alpha [Dehalococcoidia bacterium]|nr:formate dehydrogenase subunit alpha [Dehalococcoidia bacterium]